MCIRRSVVGVAGVVRVVRCACVGRRLADAREDRELAHERLLLGIAGEARFGGAPIQVVAVQHRIGERVQRDRRVVWQFRG
jgi:hypothetical protein